MSMLENKKIYTNWGCVLDEVRNGKTINSVKAGSQYILLCIDYEGMNMPLRVHVDKKFIKTYLENTGQDRVLPIYEGNEDFINKNKVIPTNIFMPVSSKYKKVINEYLKEINLPEEKKRLLEHLRYIKDNSKYPEHLKDKMGNKNRRMVNIETGEEVGVERKNGEDGR